MINYFLKFEEFMIGSLRSVTDGSDDIGGNFGATQTTFGLRVRTKFLFFDRTRIPNVVWMQKFESCRRWTGVRRKFER